jgi:hypothetical protein
MNDIHTQVYLYALEALPSAEAEEFEAHLADCDSCTTELTQLRQVTDKLSQVVSSEAPPALRGAVLATIAQTPQPPLTGHSSTPDIAPTAGRHAQPGASHGSSGAQVVPLRGSPQNRLPALLAAAAVLAALALGGWAFQANNAAEDSQEAAELAAVKTQRIGELLSADDVRVVSGRVSSTGGTGAVVMSPSRQQAMFVAADLPALPEGKVYEAWTIDERPVPAEIFTAADAKTTVPLPPDVFDARQVAVTVEPAGGSEAPTTNPVFVVTMPS